MLLHVGTFPRTTVERNTLNSAVDYFSGHSEVPRRDWWSSRFVLINLRCHCKEKSFMTLEGMIKNNESVWKAFTPEAVFLSLEMDEYCRFDFIAVYDGPSTTSGLLKQVCGRGTPTFESSSDAMTVVLSTDYANSYRGFSASYASTYVQEVNTSRSPFTTLSSFELSGYYLHRAFSLILSLSVASLVWQPVTCTWEYS